MKVPDRADGKDEDVEILEDVLAIISHATAGALQQDVFEVRVDCDFNVRGLKVRLGVPAY